MSGPRGEERGYSLVEVLIALLVLGFVLLQVLATVVTATAKVTSSQNLAELTVLAKDKMEELRRQQLDLEDPRGDLDEDLEGFSDRPGRRLLRRWRTEPIGTGEDRVVRITVRVVSESRTASPGRELVLQTEVF